MADTPRITQLGIETFYDASKPKITQLGVEAFIDASKPKITQLALEIFYGDPSSSTNLHNTNPHGKPIGKPPKGDPPGNGGGGPPKSLIIHSPIHKHYIIGDLE